MHESFKCSIIDVSVGDLQIAVDEPDGFIYFQLGALFHCCATGLNIKRINETLITMAMYQKKEEKNGGRRQVGGFTLSLTAPLRHKLTAFVHTENFTV